jgi:hypothetical protein
MSEKGRDMVAANDYPRALLEFRNASRVAPRDGEPHYEIGVVHLIPATIARQSARSDAAWN